MAQAEVFFGFCAAALGFTPTLAISDVPTAPTSSYPMSATQWSVFGWRAVPSADSSSYPRTLSLPFSSPPRSGKRVALPFSPDSPCAHTHTCRQYFKTFLLQTTRNILTTQNEHDILTISYLSRYSQSEYREQCFQDIRDNLHFNLSPIGIFLSFYG